MYAAYLRARAALLGGEGERCECIACRNDSALGREDDTHLQKKN